MDKFDSVKVGIPIQNEAVHVSQIEKPKKEIKIQDSTSKVLEIGNQSLQNF